MPLQIWPLDSLRQQIVSYYNCLDKYKCLCMHARTCTLLSYAMVQVTKELPRSKTKSCLQGGLRPVATLQIPIAGAILHLGYKTVDLILFPLCTQSTWDFACSCLLAVRSWTEPCWWPWQLLTRRVTECSQPADTSQELESHRRTSRLRGGESACNLFSHELGERKQNPHTTHMH